LAVLDQKAMDNFILYVQIYVCLRTTLSFAESSFILINEHQKGTNLQANGFYYSSPANIQLNDLFRAMPFIDTDTIDRY